MRQVTTDDGLRVGELAERAGLTVRTLHHYDRIGLVRASGRTEAGFAGGDPGIASSLDRMYQEEGPENASRGTFDADLLEYVTRAQTAAD